MGKEIKVLQTNTFKKAVKKLHPNEKKALDEAVKTIIKSPFVGEQKKGDLSFLRVYKFKMNNQLALLGYSYVEEVMVLTLISVGSHENFYTEIKRQ